MEEKIQKLLAGIVHPETGKSLVEAGIATISAADASAQKITVTLQFARTRDPFALKLKAQVETVLKAHYPEYTVTVIVREGVREGATAAHPKSPDNPQQTLQQTTTGGIAHVIAIASGKGGVGKSTVTANLAVALRDLGYRVGVLDADIYGPSQPKLFGVEGYLPAAVQEAGTDLIVPAEAHDIKLISIGFFVQPTDALLWRGAMAVNALKQLIHQTRWGALDFLLIDLPPGTGDIHLSIIHELRIDTAAIVSTPQQVAVADVVRGIELFRNEQVKIPVAGIIEKMAWFTPAELPDKRYYLFGKGGARRYAEANGVELLGEIPIVQSLMEGSDEGRPAAGIDPNVAEWYRTIAQRIVEKAVTNG